MFEKALGKVALLAMRGLTREIRQLRDSIEIGIDSQRQIAGYPPIFSEEAIATAPDPQLLRTQHANRLIQQGDFLSWWVIEQLASEFHIPIDQTTDLEQLALDRGWIDPTGVFIVMPAIAAHELGAETIAELMASPYVGRGQA